MKVRDEEGRSPMHTLAENGLTTALMYAWERQPNSLLRMDMEPRDGWTLLLLAARCNEPSLIQFLMEQGSDASRETLLVSMACLSCTCRYCPNQRKARQQHMTCHVLLLPPEAPAGMLAR